MLNETGDTRVINDCDATGKVSFSDDDRRMILGEEDMRILSDAASKVSPEAVKDLLTLGVRSLISCIFL